MVESKKVKQTKIYELKKVVQKVWCEGFVYQLDCLCQLDMNFSNSLCSFNRFEVSNDQHLFQKIHSLADRIDEHHVTKLVAQVGKNTKSCAQFRKNVETLDFQVLFRQFIVDCQRHEQQNSVGACDCDRDEQELPVTDIHSKFNQLIVDRLDVSDNSLLLMTHCEVENPENRRHRKRYHQKNLNANVNDN